MSKTPFYQKLLDAHKNCPGYPPLDKVQSFLDSLLGTLFPLRSNYIFNDIKDIEIKIDTLRIKLWSLIKDTPCSKQVKDTSPDLFFDQIEKLYNLIDTDVEAMYNGDPAASCKEEIIRSYPGFYAVSAYRIAHILEKMDVEILPRSITEIAHKVTGIDIHPGASIGEGFCIDHGTGVVIGESTVIGKNVKIYQGVTLGALSVNKADANKKRHPTIEDNVVIYAGATILGGETVVGHDSIIGGNVWLPKSIPPHSKIYYKAQMHNVNGNDVDTFLFINNEV